MSQYSNAVCERRKGHSNYESEGEREREKEGERRGERERKRELTHSDSINDNLGLADAILV